MNPDNGQLVCAVPNAAASAGVSNGAIAAGVAGVALVTIFALDDSFSGTR